MGLNRIVLLGTVAQVPEARYSPSGDVSTSFTLAVERSHGGDGKPATDYVRVVTHRALAERCAERLRQGDLVTVEGRLHTSSFETRDGHHRKAVEVDAIQVESVSTPRSGGAGPAQPPIPPPLAKLPPAGRQSLAPGSFEAPF